MKKYFGNYLGLVVDDRDPQNRGRTKVFIPHIMPALYESWNEEGKDIKFNITDGGLPTGLDTKIVDRLQKILPWAECAAPIFGAGPAGKYDYSTGALRADVQNVSNRRFNTLQKQGAGAETNQTGIGTGPLGSAGALNIPSINPNLNTTGLNGTFTQRLNGFYSEATSLGYKVAITSGYRSIERQRELYNNSRKDGSVAPPGSSAHNYGIAVDLRVTGNGVNITSFNASTDRTQNKDTPEFQNLLAKYGLHQPLHPSTKTSGISEQWHIEPIETASSDRGATAFNNVASTLTGTGAIGSGAPEVNPSIDPPAKQDANTKPDLTAETGSVQDSGITSSTTSIPVINPADVQSTGPAVPRNVSTYGSVWQDLTSYFDVKPEQRPASATQYWQSRGIDTSNPAKYNHTFGSPLDLENTGQGRGAIYSNNNLTPGFSVGVPNSGAYNLPRGSFIRVTDGAGRPVGPNGGYFQVADTGGGSLQRRNAIDFYYGNDVGFKNYFDSISNTTLNVEPVNITGQSLENLKQALGQQQNVALGGQTQTQIAGAAAQPTIQHTTPVASVGGPNTNYMPTGMFGGARTGQTVWVFFQEGNPLFPVYFAAAYGEKEWANINQASSPGLKNPFDSIQNVDLNMSLDGGGITSKQIISNQKSGFEKDDFVFQVYGKNGSALTFTFLATLLNSKYDFKQHTQGDAHYITGGNRTDRTTGDHNIVCEQDLIITVGNWSQEALDAANEIQGVINEAMKAAKDIYESDGGGSTGGNASQLAYDRDARNTTNVIQDENAFRIDTRTLPTTPQGDQGTLGSSDLNNQPSTDISSMSINNTQSNVQQVRTGDAFAINPATTESAFTIKQ